ncbi:unnamed protein product, partial [Sphenostylis stenocarpa]
MGRAWTPRRATRAWRWWGSGIRFVLERKKKWWDPLSERAYPMLKNCSDMIRTVEDKIRYDLTYAPLKVSSFATFGRYPPNHFRLPKERVLGSTISAFTFKRDRRAKAKATIWEENFPLQWRCLQTCEGDDGRFIQRTREEGIDVRKMMEHKRSPCSVDQSSYTSIASKRQKADLSISTK